MSDPEAPLVERLRALVGVAGAPDVARDPVNLPMIRHWCDAMGDANPVYTDPDFAAKSVHGALVAPPAMLNAWTMPGLPGRPRASDGPNAMRLLDEAGFTSVIATNSEHEYVRYLRLGDRLHGENELVEVSDEKRTALARVESSFPSIGFSQTAAENARRNLEIVQDKYAQGLVNITDLLEAQTESLRAEQTEAASVYLFLIDLISFQRAIAWFEFEKTPEERDRLLQQIQAVVQQ